MKIGWMRKGSEQEITAFPSPRLEYKIYHEGHNPVALSVPPWSHKSEVGETVLCNVVASADLTLQLNNFLLFIGVRLLLILNVLLPFDKPVSAGIVVSL